MASCIQAVLRGPPVDFPVARCADVIHENIFRFLAI